MPPMWITALYYHTIALQGGSYEGETSLIATTLRRNVAYSYHPEGETSLITTTLRRNVAYNYHPKRRFASRW